MNVKLCVLMGCLAVAGLFIGIGYADNDHNLTIDGFNNCKITTTEIVNCIGFNTVHNDNEQIKTLLNIEIQNQKTIIDQNSQIISLLTPTHDSQLIKIGSKCFKSGTGKICDP